MDISIVLLSASVSMGVLNMQADDAPASPQPAASSPTQSAKPAIEAEPAPDAAPPKSAESMPTGVATTQIRVVSRTDGATATVERDPTLISVPSNTLGAGEPLWVRREREQAAARIAAANASYAEARAAYARVEAQRAASDDEDNSYRGIVIYGPHRPGLHRAVLSRPRPLVLSPTASDTRNLQEDELHGQAQREFFEASYPRNGPAIEGQLDAQRQFGRMATPPVVQPQRDRDDAVIRARKVTRPPE